MVAHRRPLGVVALVLFLGLVVGTVLGELIGVLIPEGKTLREVFVGTSDFQFGPFHLNLVVFSITLGFSLHLNLMSVLGIFLVSLILRWYW